MKKRFFAAALAATMVVSTAMTASAETLTGTAWWTGMQTGTDYAMEDGTVTLEVKTSSDAGAFSVEVYTTGYFFTTGSDGNAWFAEGLTGTVSNPFADNGNADPGKFVAGNTYEVTATIDGSTYTVEYYDATAGQLIYTMTGECTAENVPAASEFKVHVMAQVGTYEVSQVVKATEEDTTVSNPSAGTGDVEEDTTASNPSAGTGDVEEDTTASNPSAGTGDVEEDTTASTTTDSTTTTDSVVEVLPESSEAYQAVASSTEVAGNKFCVANVSAAKGATVTVDVEDLELGDVTYVDVYQLVDGVMTKVATVKVVDGKIQFESAGEGEYVFVAATAEEETTTAATTETTTAGEATKTDGPKTGDTAPIAVLAAVAALAGAGVVVSRKKRA